MDGVSGLGFLGVSVGGALAPGVLRALLYPNHADALPFALVAAEPLGATVLWPFLAAWCLSWAEPAVLVQLLISRTYSFLAGRRPRAGPRPAEAA